MKKEDPLRNLFGASQLEMAILLRISRAQWSMYESGKRDLPLKAKQRLIELLQYFKETEPHTGRVAEESYDKQKLEWELRENEYQRHRIARQMEEATKQEELVRRRLWLITYINNHNAQQRGETLPELFALKPKSRLPTLAKLQDLHASLVSQQQVLESRLYGGLAEQKNS